MSRPNAFTLYAFRLCVWFRMKESTLSTSQKTTDSFMEEFLRSNCFSNSPASTSTPYFYSHFPIWMRFGFLTILQYHLLHHVCITEHYVLSSDDDVPITQKATVDCREVSMLGAELHQISLINSMGCSFIILTRRPRTKAAWISLGQTQAVNIFLKSSESFTEWALHSKTVDGMMASFQN